MRKRHPGAALLLPCPPVAQTAPDRSWSLRTGGFAHVLVLDGEEIWRVGLVLDRVGGGRVRIRPDRTGPGSRDGVRGRYGARHHGESSTSPLWGTFLASGRCTRSLQGRRFFALTAEEGEFDVELSGAFRSALKIWS